MTDFSLDGSNTDAADWRDMVSYFIKEKGDPTRFTGWSEEKCAEYWPELLFIWKQYDMAHRTLLALARNP